MNAIKPHAREVLDYLRSIGADAVRLDHGGKHMRAVFTWRESTRFFTFPSTPGDTMRGMDNAISEIRHMLNLIERKKRIGARRPPRARFGRLASTPISPAINIDFSPDWRRRLGDHPASVAMIQGRLDLAWVTWWREILARNGGRSRL